MFIVALISIITPVKTGGSPVKRRELTQKKKKKKAVIAEAIGGSGLLF